MVQEIAADSKKIEWLISRMADGEIKIPPLQRPFVWKTEDIIKLLESIYNDYPIGSILLWETMEKLPGVRNIAGFKLPERNPAYPINFVLDGQQRLATLYGVFCSDRTEDNSSAGYEIKTNNFEILFNLDVSSFVHVDEREDGKRYVEMKNLLDNTKFVKMLTSVLPEDMDTVTHLKGVFSNYEIPRITTKKRKLEEVGIIFERINNSGTRLGLFDLMVAWTWTKDFHLQDEFNEIFNALEAKNFEEVQKKIILQCISGIIRESSKTKVILSLEPEEVRDKFGLLSGSIEKTVDYLSTEFAVKSAELLPHSHQMVPLCYLFSQVNIPDALQKKVISEWFWKTSFSRRYSYSTDTHIDEDIAAFKKLIENGDTSVFSKLNYTVSEEQIKETKFRKTNPYSRAFVVLLANKRPKNLITGGEIDTGEAVSSFNKKEYHHVFPKAFLMSRSEYKEKADSLCNFCLLPSDSNKKILDAAPSVYFRSMIPQESYKEILESNLLPVKRGIYDKDDYSQFMSARAGQIIRLLDQLINS